MGVYASLPKNCHGIVHNTNIGMADMTYPPGKTPRPVFVRNHQVVYPYKINQINQLDSMDSMNSMNSIYKLHNLAHLPAINRHLFVTSMYGAVHARYPSSIVGVCDSHTGELVAAQRDKKTSYDFFLVDQDSEQVTAHQFVMQFVKPGRKIAARLAAKQPVVVHCQMGMNRSCTAICMAALLMHRLNCTRMATTIDYVRKVNKQVRHDVLTNRAFVRLLIGFADFLAKIQTETDQTNQTNQTHQTRPTKLSGMASSFQVYYHKNKSQYYSLFDRLGVLDV
jgi:hypothetical protein